MNISVAMCTYNGARYLEEQLQSIAAQTAPPSELIICDDGSTDSTAGIVERFATAVSFPVRFHRNEANLGSTKNFEQAILLCRGEAIALCDQDDVWLPEKLERMTAVLENQPEVAGVFSGAALIDDAGRLLPVDLWQRGQFTRKRQTAFRKAAAPFQLVASDTVTGATLLFRRSYLPQILPISPEWVHDGWIALILAAIAELRPLPECMMSYRLHAQQQIGASEDHWYDHLSTQKEKALASHRHLARRFSAMADRLDALASSGIEMDRGVAKALRQRAAYLQHRTAVLERPRTLRLLPAVRLLPDYVRYQSGVMSLLRDVLHR